MSDAPSGSIYDLGYRRYEGLRLGRGYAFISLYLASLRAAFGLGRGAGAKVFTFGLTALAFLPAVIQLGIGALAEGIVDLFEAHAYYGYTQVILALFCATVAPDLVGRDQRTRTLSLYFSRSLNRVDYAAAKYGALATALLALTLAPQLLLFVGNGLATNDVGGYMADEWTQVWPIVTSAALLSAFIAGIAIVIAAQTPRRAYSTVAILAVFMLAWIVGAVVIETVQTNVALPLVLFSPFHTMRAFTLFLFGVDPDPASPTAEIYREGWLYLAGALGWVVVSALLLIRRYERIDP